MSETYPFQGDYFHRLHRLIQERGADEALCRLDNRAFKIKPKASLAFPVRDVDRIEEDDEEMTLYCQFMGLYGVDSPLPMYFNQICLSDEPVSHALRDFLDLFNHRNYVLYFLAWRGFQPEFATEAGDRGYLDFVGAMSGRLLDDDSLALANAMTELNSTSLYHLMDHLMPACPVQIVESIPQWLRIDHPKPLGEEQAFVLGDTSLIGQRMLDTSRSIRMDIGPLTWEQSLQCLPGGSLQKALWRLIHQHYALFFDVSIQLLIRVDKPNVILGQSDLCLGRLTWVGEWKEEVLPSLMKVTAGRNEIIV